MRRCGRRYGCFSNSLASTLEGLLAPLNYRMPAFMPGRITVFAVSSSKSLGHSISIALFQYPGDYRPMWLPESGSRSSGDEGSCTTHLEALDVPDAIFTAPDLPVG